MPEITFRQAVARGLREALDSDERVFLMGEDINHYQGPYAVTRGMGQEYGEERVKDTPISESAVVGAGVGAAMAGLRPIVEVMTINFILLAMDQVVNNAAKLRYMSNGQITVPLVIRTVTEAGRSSRRPTRRGLEGWFASVPGLKVAVPSDPYDALGLLRTSIADEDPVIFAEHALLYNTRGEVPDEQYEVPLGEAAVKREGADVTLVAYGRMVPRRAGRRSDTRDAERRGGSGGPANPAAARRRHGRRVGQEDEPGRGGRGDVADRRLRRRARKRHPGAGFRPPRRARSDASAASTCRRRTTVNSSGPHFPDPERVVAAVEGLYGS